MASVPPVPDHTCPLDSSNGVVVYTKKVMVPTVRRRAKMETLKLVYCDVGLKLSESSECLAEIVEGAEEGTDTEPALVDAEAQIVPKKVGACIWPAAQTWVHFMSRAREGAHEATAGNLLELGSGTGLCGLCCAATALLHDGTVVLSDKDEQVLGLIERTVALNAKRGAIEPGTVVRRMNVPCTDVQTISVAHIRKSDG
jgi:hypothetical protein